MMFRSVTLTSRDVRLRQAWDGLMRRIQATIETIRVTNATTEPMFNGHIVKLVPGVRMARLADEWDGDRWTGVLVEDCAPGETAICRHSNLACVLFAPGQPKPIEGELAYFGPAPGVAYVGGDQPIGEIADASRYVPEEHPFAKVLLMRLARRTSMAPVGAGDPQS